MSDLNTPAGGPSDDGLPGWLTPLPDAAQQRATDAWAINDRGIPSIGLMEHAGAGLASLVQARAPDGRVVVVAGKGNNGGDGLVVARLLRDAGRQVDVLLLAPGEQFQGDARANFDRLPGPPAREFEPEAVRGAGAIVDAILGTGFSGEPRDPARGAISAINDAAGEAVVFACDVPSGVDASTGEVIGAAVRADVTATFHAAKPGLWINPGKEHAGEVHVIDIGIPDGAPIVPSVGLIDPAVVDGIPRRGQDSNKFAAGAVLVCGGSTGLTGAPSMACESAMRAGAGYVTALIPASLNIVFEQRLLEVMSVPLPDGGDGALRPKAAEIVLEHAARANALVLGPGLGRSDKTFELARRLAAQVQLPLLLDADGLNAHAGRLQSLASRPAATVVTPHAGELARLLESDSSEIGAHRLASARHAAEQAQAIVVLKGDDTIVAAPDGRAAVNRGGAPALATAGTGDVLSGVIGAYLSKRMDPFHAACAGVFVHARAGRLAADAIAAEGVIASDVIAQLPRARAERG
jgi:ADP-dependent NAD(P)H-hydrate dehydratase / NAD(P)H-hydrate epimerase